MYFPSGESAKPTSFGEPPGIGMEKRYDAAGAAGGVRKYVAAPTAKESRAAASAHRQENAFELSAAFGAWVDHSSNARTSAADSHRSSESSRRHRSTMCDREAGSTWICGGSPSFMTGRLPVAISCSNNPSA